MSVVYNFQDLAAKVVAALREEFPHDTIATEEGYQGRVRVKLVSERFNGMTEREKQDVIWSILESHLNGETAGISMAIAYGTDEL